MEYVGLTVVAAGVLIGLAQTPLGDDVVRTCRTAICQITGGTDCAVAEAGGDGPTPDATAVASGTPHGPFPPTPTPSRDPDCEWAGLNGAPPRIHSHNDYTRDNILTDALDHKAASVEADIFHDDGDLALRHDDSAVPDFIEGGEKGQLGDDYIEPLKERVRRNGGKVYPDRNEPFDLNVEIKSGDREAQEKAFRETVRLYRELQAEVVAAGGEPENVRLVFSGNSPEPEEWSRVLDGPAPRGVYADRQYSGDSCDDAPTDDLGRSSAWVSLNWEECVSGDDDVTPEEQDYLNRVVENAHAQGKKVRVWGAPEDVETSEIWDPTRPGSDKTRTLRDPSDATVEAWRAQAQAGVDLMNTDSLTTMREFLGDCAD